MWSRRQAQKVRAGGNTVSKFYERRYNQNLPLLIKRLSQLCLISYGRCDALERFRAKICPEVLQWERMSWHDLVTGQDPRVALGYRFTWEKILEKQWYRDENVQGFVIELGGESARKWVETED